MNYKKNPLSFVLANLLAVAGTTQADVLDIEEITVTAQKREQSVQDVALSVTAFTGDDMRTLGFERPADIAAQTPGVTVKSAISDTNPVISIRGIGLNDLSANSNPPVSVYIDDIFLASNVMMNFQLLDVERTEVLKGPQGTLYGRNTTGGAVKFISAKPTQEFEAYVNGDYDSWGGLKVEGAVSGGLSDSVAGRLAVSTKQRSGGWEDRVDENGLEHEHGDQDRGALRASLTWEGTGVDLLASVHYGYDDSETQLYDHWPTVDPVTFGSCSDYLAGNIAAAQRNCIDFVGFQDTDGDQERSYSDFPNRVDNEGWGGNLTVNWQLDGMVLTSVTGYEAFDRRQLEDWGSNNLNTAHADWNDDITAFSQEIRLASDGSDISWIVGAFFSKENHENEQVLEMTDLFGPASFFDTLTEFEQDTRTAALFGHIEVPLNDEWQLISGLRYTDEKKEYTGGSFGLECSQFPDCGFNGTEFQMTSQDDDFREENLSGTVGIQYMPSEDAMWYANYSRGFKSGGWSGNLTFADFELDQYDPEYVDAYEIGFKGSFAEGTVQLNTAMFYYDWADLQNVIAVLITDPNTGGQVVSQKLTNAGDAEIYGWEADLTWFATDNLLVRLGANYLDSEVVSSEDGSLDGMELGQAPEWTFNGLVRYRNSLSGDLNYYAQVDFNYQSDVFFTINNQAPLSEEAYTLVNARVGINPSNEQWEVALWARNLADKEYKTYALDLSDIGWTQGVWGQPRSAGISVSYHFE